MSTADALTGGAAPAATAAAAPAATAAAAPAAGDFAWLGGADELTTGFVQNKGWKSAVDAVQSYQNLEKLMGADRAGNTVVLPKPDATPQEWSAFHNRLGRPAEAAGYKLDLPEGANKDFATAAAAKFHELGLTQTQGEALAKWNNEQLAALTQSQTAAKQAEFQTQDAALKSEWGQAYNQNLAQAQAAVRGLGLDDKTINSLSAALGHKATMEMLQKIGAKSMEADFVTGDNQGGDRAITPGQAKATIKDRMSDKAFTARYMAKDAQAVAEMKRLHEFAYPTET